MTVIMNHPIFEEQFPRHRTGTFTVHDFSDHESLTHLPEELLGKLDHQKIEASIAHWQDTFRRMTESPKYRSSLSYLYDTYKEKSALPDINPVVNVYNAYSLYLAAPMGAYNLDAVVGDIRLEPLEKGSLFTPMTARKQTEKTKAGEIGYRDDEKVLCRFWNHQDCYETRITEDTRNMLFMFDLMVDSPEDETSLMAEILSDFNSIFNI